MHVSPEMEKLILKCLSKDPSKRFSNAAALLTALTKTPIYDTEAGQVQIPGQSRDYTSRNETFGGDEQRQRDKTKMVLWGGGALALLLLALLVDNFGRVTIPTQVSGVQQTSIVPQVGDEQQAVVFQDPTSVPTEQRPAPTRTATLIPPTAQPADTDANRSVKICKYPEEDGIYVIALRESPGLNAPKMDVSDVGAIMCGEIVEVSNDSQQADGRTWWWVTWNGYSGWMAERTSSGAIIIYFD